MLGANAQTETDAAFPSLREEVYGPIASQEKLIFRQWLLA
jgi:hypothetical protein